MSLSDPCPCGTDLDYAACCQPLHLGVAAASTAEALMRSRYAAFARGEVAYLVRTLDPSRRRLHTAGGIQKTIEPTRWTGLRVLDTDAGSETDDAGEVEFVAFFEGADGIGQLHERSRFRRASAGWLYVDAMDCRVRPPGRQEPCWCGSGRRARRCHG